ncbi:hypothetical protein [Mesorhizobium carmichaelinearum]|uniref:hypothetical protein n=1 Tax=Mesorhizobium carmichaelinearum TaxID=1208188 RepID=UPI000BA4C682|nr:hypothetical protein [Mesorhizobium carmichaelinearum]
MTDLDKLNEHFGIEPSAEGFIALLRALMVKPEPGFRPHKRRRSGRPRDYEKDIALILDADRVITERQCSDRAAVRILVTSRRFKCWNRENGRTLENRLYGARRDEEIMLVVQEARKEASARGLDLYAVDHEGSMTVEARQVPKKTSVIGLGDVQGQAKAAEGAQWTEQPDQKAAPTPPKPADPKSEDELTNAEWEALRQARSMFDGTVRERRRSYRPGYAPLKPSKG